MTNWMTVGRSSRKIQLYRKKVLKTMLQDNGSISHIWEDVRLVPEIDAWFETQWAAFRKKEIYDCE
jgi:hypothetical protein